MNYPVIQKKSRNRVVTNRYPRLSHLNINIVLDHAGGHDSSTCRRRKLLQRPQRYNAKYKSDKNTKMIDSNSRPFPNTNQSHEHAVMDKILPNSPIIKKHNKKLYIRLNDNPSQEAMARKEKTWTKPDTTRARILTQSPLSIKFRRQNATIAVPAAKTQRRRRHSTGNMPCFTAKSTTVQEFRQQSTESSQLTTHQPSQGKLKISRSRSMGYWRQQEPPNQMQQQQQQQQHDNSPIRKEDKNKSRRSHKLVDSPAGTFQRIPKGYIRLFPDPFDLTSETSCSTHSSIVAEPSHLIRSGNK